MVFHFAYHEHAKYLPKVLILSNYFTNPCFYEHFSVTGIAGRENVASKSTIFCTNMPGFERMHEVSI